MGCSGSKDGGKGEKTTKLKVTVTAPASQRKLDPKDFISSKLKDETVVKPPGSIDGQQYIIEECENCDIFILDWSAQVTVDVCKSCRIFIGPCESSVSIRNCDDCTLVVACQQYRIRDCKNLKTLLYVGGDPALETSEGSEFGCFQYSYFTLAEQFAKAKLSVHNNQWSRVHDFGGGTGQKSSWKIMSQAESSPLEILKRVSELSDAISKEEEEAYEEHPVVPPTWGRRAPSTAENGSLVLFWSTEAAQKFYSVMSAYNKTHEEHPLLMVETQEALVTADQVKQVVGNAPAGRPITAAGGAIGVEVCMEGPEASAALAEVLAATGLLDGEGYYASEAPGGKDVQVWFQQMQESRGICFVTG